MRTGSLRTRVAVTTLALFAIVLTAVVAAVTLAYRAKLDGDLHTRLANAGAALERAGSGSRLKFLLPGLALEGIAIHFARTPATGRTGSSPTIETRGSLLTLHEALPQRMDVTLTASRASIDHAVTNLLLVELLVAGSALAVAALLVVQGTRTALRPLSAVVETATRIAHGESNLRLNPNRTDTELGSLAAAFDRMVDALEAAIEEARASDAATRRFLADASHELRTPIAALQASIETLLREQPRRPERDRLEAAVARDGERLGRLVNDLLGLARLEAQQTRVPIDLTAIARPLIEDARTRAPRAEITLTADGDATVRGDPDALDRVLRNLIDNALGAIQSTGRIEVRLRRRNGYVQAHVKDNGPGVPEDQRERIFERFARLDPTKPGHGLGLAIARRIAHQHNGELTCDDIPRGASFTLHLPIEA